MKRGAGLLGAILALWLAAWPVFADPPMWVIERKGARIVLFGSVHLLSPRAVWRTPALDAELARAESLWFEIPFDAQSRGQASATAAVDGLLPAGQTLRSLMTPTGRARLERIGPELGLTPDLLDRLRPWLAEVMITTAQAVSDGASEKLGVENQLQSIAPPELRRRAFETPAQQIGFFAGATLPAQLASLEDSLRQIEDDPNAFKTLEEAWTSGDVEALIAQAVEPMRREAPDLYDRLVTSRNRRWVTVIRGLLKRRERALIVVGVGHLVGPGGVPALLRAKGIRVEGP
jgi:uncharacterized protein YbaP (TraB family)